MRLTRRATLLAGSGLVVAFASGCAIVPPIPKRPLPTNEDALGWIQLNTEGQWVLWCPRMEMGQHIDIALRNLAAHELGVLPESITVRLPSTGNIARAKATVGSDSVRELAEPLSRACRALRDAVLSRASTQWGVPTANLRFETSTNPAVQRVLDRDNRGLDLSRLASPPMTLLPSQVAKSELKLWQSAPVSTNTTQPNVSDLAIVRGQPLYAADLPFPNILFAVVLRPPVADQEIAPTPLVDMNEAAVREIPGFFSIVRHASLVGPALVATRMSALAGMVQAANARWAQANWANTSGADATTVDVDQAIKRDDFTKSKGKADLRSPNNNSVALNLRIDTPLASHATIEPRCAVAVWHDQAGGNQANTQPILKLWCGTQDLFFIRDVLKRDFDLPLERIEVQAMRMGGAFGARTLATVEREAALIAKLVARPVKVQWSREDEFSAGFNRPPSSQRIQARLTPGAVPNATKLVAWRHSLASSHVLFTNAVAPPWLQRITNFIGDDGAARGQAPLYGIEQIQLDLHLKRLPVFTGPWRGLGAGCNVLAIEIAMDAAAAMASADPIAFRLNHLQAGPYNAGVGEPDRAAACLKRLAALIPPFKPGPQNDPQRKQWIANGVACGAYKGLSYAAAGAQVAIALNADGSLNAVKVLKLWCVHDCGRVIDADGVVAQIQGNLVWCMGMVLSEGLKTDNGGVTTRSFSEYRIPRLTDMPTMHIELMNSTADPTGAGETAMVAGAGAIANAVLTAMNSAGQPRPTHLRLPLVPG